MTWFKVDDGFWSNPKTMTMSEAATSLWVRAGAYACQHLTDGFIDASLLSVLGSRDAADELVARGLWKKERGGFQFHDWDDYQETRAIVLQRREQAKERMQRAREAKKRSREHIANEQRTSREVPRKFAAGSHNPDPTRPDPATTPNGVVEGARKRAPSQATALPHGWSPDDDLIAEMRSECPGVDLDHETRKFRDYWIAQGGQRGRKKDWRATWRNWIRRAAENAPTRARPNTHEAWSTPAGEPLPSELPTFDDVIEGEVLPFRRGIS